VSQLDVITALVAEGVRKQMGANRKYLASSERSAIATDAAAVAIAVLIDQTGGHHHIVKSDGETFTLQHPLVERLTGGLFECDLLDRIRTGQPIEQGHHRVLMNDDPTDCDLIPLKEFS
jgi:hypothetical protein